MSNFGGLHIAYTGLNTHARRINVIGENIANVNTPGYHRQRVELSPISSTANGTFTGRAASGGGVSVTSITRLRDHVLSGHARAQAGVAADRSSAADTLQGLERIVGGLESGGLHDQMTALFNSFDDLANSPEDTAMRQVVLQRAEGVAQGFSRTASAMDQLWQRQVVETFDVVRAINLLTEQIAVVDGEILGATNAESYPNALLDQRDHKVAELASLADIFVVENDNGQVVISLDGQLLVSNGRATALSVDTKPDATLALLGYSKISVVNPSGRELTIGGGQLSANLNAVTQIIPDGRRELDAVTADLASQVNALHQAGVGLDGSTGLDLFTLIPISGHLEVSVDVAGLTDKVAAARAGSGILDNGNARFLAQLADSPTGPLAGFTEMVGSLASRVATAAGTAEAAEAASAQASSLALSAGGVSLDEELTDLITAQRSYEAAARLITAIDEMMQTLITRTGLVGR